MTDFNHHLAQKIHALRNSGLHRELRRVESPQSSRIEADGHALLNFSSNDYLGLANHPALKAAAIQAVERYGAGAGASRLISGSLGAHHDLEETLAAFKDTEATLSFSTGYAAALGSICGLMGKGDIIIIDKLVHASIVDAARLSGAKLRVFDHNDLDDLENILTWASQTQPATTQPHTLVVTESVFSMDGDHAPLKRIVELKEKYGAWLMVDEAHATGLYGPNRRGLAEACGLSHRIEVQMGTLGKAIGASGGYICGSRTLIDYLVNTARTFIFSTAPVPAAAAAAAAGIRLIQSADGEARRTMLWQNVSAIPAALGSAFSLPSDWQSAIIPLPIGDEARAVETAAALRGKGIFIPAIRYPTVARGQARLRLTVTASHTSADIEALRGALSALTLAPQSPNPACTR